MTYHLGADYFEDPDGTFVSQPKKYIDKLADTYKRLFNEDPPKGYKTALEKNDHPELDTSEILEGDMAAKYLTMVGQLQWLVSLGRFDIHAQVATMSRFRAAPSQGHMDRLKRIYSYAIRTKDYAIRFRTEQPDYSFLSDQDFDWTYSVYGDVHKILPDDMPEPLGEAVTTTTTMDANLNHCLATGKSLTGCPHFVNKTPVDWYFNAEVATMSRFRAAPRQGHMDRLKRIYSYANRTKDYAIGFRTDQPDYSFLPDQDFDWTYSVYDSVQEILPDDMPEPLGEAVITTTTMDANLNHWLATGKFLTGCLHFVNKTPVDWYSKKQATVETATYGSEFVAAKTATEQIMDIRQTLRYLGAPIGAKSFLFGDNRSVVTSAVLPCSTLTKSTIY